MSKESKINKRLLCVAVVVNLVLQLPSIYVIYMMSETARNFKIAYTEILASESADNTDIEFIARLKKDANFKQDIQILVGPYKRLYGDDFRYRLEKRLVLVEQSQTTKETFLILFDKTFYNELDHEQHKGVLAHEMEHILNLTQGPENSNADSERNADNRAIRYVSINTMIDLCRKYEGDDLMREIRISNLRKQGLIGPYGGLIDKE